MHLLILVVVALVHGTQVGRRRRSYARLFTNVYESFDLALLHFVPALTNVFTALFVLLVIVIYSFYSQRAAVDVHNLQSLCATGLSYLPNVDNMWQLTSQWKQKITCVS